MEKFIIVFLVALAISYILTPYAKKLAYKIGAIDIPKDNRRVHTKPMPRLGGLAIYISFIITALMTLQLTTELVGLLIGATMIVAIGIIDDCKQISAKLKLLVQILAALVVVYSGVRIEGISFALSRGGYIGLGVLSVPLTVFWIVGITNTVNLIDGLDGLAAGVSFIAALSLAYVAYGQSADIGTSMAMLLIILAGGLLGFLPYNFNPAQIFMGDTGSLLIGFLLATISVEGLIKSATTLAVAIPILALGVPVFDTAFAIIRRLVNKRPIMEADKGHLHHKLLEHGFSQKQTVLVLYFISAVLGGSAVLISESSRMTAYQVLLIIATTVLLGALRIGLMKKNEERKVNM